MHSTMRITLISLVGFLLSLPGSLAQDVTIKSPTKGSNVMTGQKLQIVLQMQGTTSSVTHIAFSTGFKNTSKKDETSLGRPYVGSVFAEAPSTSVAHDAGKGTYTYEIDVPAENDFPDGLSIPYELTVSDYYVLGATHTPVAKLTSIQVNVQNSNSTGGGAPSDPNGGKPNNPNSPTDPSGGKAPTGPNGSPVDPNKPTSAAESIRRPAYFMFFLAATYLLVA